MRFQLRVALVVAAYFSFFVVAVAQEGERISLNTVARLDSGPEGSFAFTCMIEVDQPANSQLTVRLLQISGGKTTTARASTFSWRGAEATGVQTITFDGR